MGVCLPINRWISECARPQCAGVCACGCVCVRAHMLYWKRKPTPPAGHVTSAQKPRSPFCKQTGDPDQLCSGKQRLAFLQADPFMPRCVSASHPSLIAPESDFGEAKSGPAAAGFKAGSLPSVWGPQPRLQLGHKLAGPLLAS